MSYCVTWDAGATAEIEFISPEQDGNYRLRYNPPYRTTLRSPVDTLRVGPQELDNSREALQRFAQSIHLIDGRGAAAPGAGAEPEPMKQLERIGQELFEFMLPRHVRSDLDDETFIELALDEQLTALPWEVMFDGEEFLSHKHALGRFITLRQALPADTRRRQLPNELDELKVLVIGVPRPTPPPNGEAYEELPAVRPEVNQIVETLAEAGVGVEVLLDDDATYDNVRDELRKPYHIVHYTGHAAFDEERPSGSALLLFDRPLTTGALMVSFSEHPALLCFINGCETSRPEAQAAGGAAEATWENRYNNYGLARSFLETGTYLLGSRWRLEDNAARTFAKSFYEHLLGEGKPVGKAICAARRATAEAGDPFCAWASYIYYGDPRIGIRRLEPAPAAAGPGVAFGVAPAEPPPEPAVEEQVELADALQLQELAAEYEQTRAAMDPGPARTQQMTEIAHRASALAEEDGPTAALEELYAHGEGGRVIALAQMRAAPTPEHLPMVETSITQSLSAFEQYVALEVASGLVDRLDDEQTETLRGALELVSEREDFYGTDGFPLAARILTRLAQQSGDGDELLLA